MAAHRRPYGGGGIAGRREDLRSAIELLARASYDRQVLVGTRAMRDPKPIVKGVFERLEWGGAGAWRTGREPDG